LSPCLLVFFLAGCGSGQKASVATKATEVVVDVPVTRQITDYEEFTGHAEAVDSIDLRARVTGYLESVNFKVGDEVKQGDVLFEIDKRPYKAALDQAEAQVTLADARLKDAAADAERNRMLVGSGSVSRSDYDKLVADRDVAAAQVVAAKAAAETNRLNLNFCTVTSPISGRISRRNMDPGNLVKADDTILTRINSQDPVYGYFDVDERTLLKIRRLVREGLIFSARSKEVPVYLALAHATPASSTSPTIRWTPTPARSRCAACSRTPCWRVASGCCRRECSCASACGSARRTTPCSSASKHWALTRATSSSTSSAKSRRRTAS
jgi:multidrug efflux pump subunit AcrA (membrane-fusion protein)